MPDATSIAAEVRSFVIENYLFGQKDGLADSDSFLESGIIDSTGVLELISFLENSYGIKIDGEEITTENLDSIDRVCAYLRSKFADRKDRL